MAKLLSFADQSPSLPGAGRERTVSRDVAKPLPGAAVRGGLMDGDEGCSDIRRCCVQIKIMYTELCVYI